MPDYQEMYLTLARAQNKAICILQEAQQKAEDEYITSEPTVLRLFPVEPLEETNDPSDRK